LNPVWSPDGGLIVYSGVQVAGAAPLQAVTAEGKRIELPLISVVPGGERFRFLPDGKGLVYLRGSQAGAVSASAQDFWLLDLATKTSRRLTRLSNGASMRTFDIARDGKLIVFDRLRDNSNLVLIDLSGSPKQPQDP